MSDTATALFVSRSATAYQAEVKRRIIPVAAGDGYTLPAERQSVAAAATPSFSFVSGLNQTLTGIKRWPLVTPECPRVNAVTNPRAYVDLSDWIGWPNENISRVTSIEGISLPSGANAAFYVSPCDGGAGLESEPFALPPGSRAGDHLAVQCWIATDGVEEGDCWLDAIVYFTYMSDEIRLSGEDTALPLGEFVRFTGRGVIPVGETTFTLSFTHNNIVEGGADDAKLYVTKVMVERFEVGVYADGDSSGWDWRGTPHDSVSTEVLS